MKHRFKAFALLLLSAVSSPKLLAEEADRRLPDEYETAGGHTLGMAHGGSVASGGVGAVRMNPGMLPMEQGYIIGGGYNWPAVGRDFYQLGIVDTKSSKVAAGFSYSSFAEKFNSAMLLNGQKDSTVNRRFNLGLGYVLEKVSLGMGFQYLEAQDLADPFSPKKLKGTALVIGAAGLLTPNLRFGVSAENLANKKIANYAPQVFRVGTAYLMGDGNLSLHLDYKQRERVEFFEKTVIIDGLNLSPEEKRKIQQDNQRYEDPERLVIASFSARVYDMLRLLGGFGQSLGGVPRQSAGAGLALVSKNFSLSYTAARPHLSYPESHQAVNLSYAASF